MTEPFPQPPAGGAAVRPEDGDQDDWQKLVVASVDDDQDDNDNPR